MEEYSMRQRAYSKAHATRGSLTAAVLLFNNIHEGSSGPAAASPVTMLRGSLNDSSERKYRTGIFVKASGDEVDSALVYEGEVSERTSFSNDVKSLQRLNKTDANDPVIFDNRVSNNYSAVQQ